MTTEKGSFDDRGADWPLAGTFFAAVIALYGAVAYLVYVATGALVGS